MVGSMSLAARLESYRASHPTRRVGEFEYTVGGNGPALLVLHGGGSVAEAAHPFAIPLEEHARVIAVDWPAAARSVSAVLDGLVAVLDAEGASTFAVLGFSMGGMLAQALAARCPDRVSRFVLYVSMGPSVSYASKFRRYAWGLRVVPGPLLVAASKRAAAKWTATASDPEAAAFLASHRRWTFESGRVSKTSLLSDAAILVDFFSGPLPSLDCPIMIVEAAEDRMVGVVERERLRLRYPHAEILTLRATDHFAGVLAPVPIVERLVAFLHSSNDGVADE